MALKKKSHVYDIYYLEWQTTEEGQRAKQLKHCDKKKYKDINANENEENNEFNIMR